MNAIALIIFLDQFNRIFGLAGKIPLQGNLIVNFCLAAGTFLFILQIKRILSLLRVPSKIADYIPGVLISIIIFTGFQHLFNLHVETVELGVEVHSFSDYLSLIAGYFPTFQVLQVKILSKAVTFAIELSLLAYFDSLLTSMVVDKITKEETDKDKELFAQGLANGVSGFLGGLPGAQATVNSVLLIKEGAVTRLAGILVGVFVFLGILLFKDMIGLIAMSIFSGILIKIAWDIAEKEFFKMYFHNKWYRQAEHNWQLAIILYTMAVTVLVDLNIAVITSVVIFYAIQLKKYLSGLLGISLGLLLTGSPLRSLNASLNSLNFDYVVLWVVITVIYSFVFLYFQKKGGSINDIDYTGLHLKEYSPR
jgi:SulP family sulfate permease